MALTSYKLTITGTIINATCNYSDGDYLDSEIPLVISANSGAIFEGVFKYKRGVSTQTMVNNTTNLTINTSSFRSDITLNGNYVAIGGVTEYVLTQTLVNCTSNLTGEKIEEEENKEIVLTSNNGYVFKTIPTITINGVVSNFVLSESNTKATIVINVDSDVEIVANAELNTLTSYKLTITGTIINATCNYNDGDYLDSEIPLIISANNGYEFKGVFKYNRGGATQAMVNNTTNLTINTSSFRNNIILDKEYKAIKKAEQIGSFVNLYKTNQVELTQLSKKRFVIDSNNNLVDYGQFINSLYILPFSLPNEIIGDRTNILLGNLDSNVESTLINNYMYEFTGGEISVPLKYENVYDYINTECILHLPYLDKVYINNEYVIGQTLTIDFIIDLYSSTLTSNVKSSFNDKIIHSSKNIIGSNIPFIQKSNNSVINSISNVYKNMINKSFIEVVRNIPYNVNSIFGNEVIEYGLINDYKGFIKCDNVVLNSNATNQEKEEIVKLLNEGVIL